MHACEFLTDMMIFSRGTGISQQQTVSVLKPSVEKFYIKYIGSIDQTTY